MTEITFQQSSPRGTATIDTARLVVNIDGRVWICSGEPGSQAGLTPVTGEQAAALHAHFGALWVDALDAMTALDDG